MAKPLRGLPVGLPDCPLVHLAIGLFSFPIRCFVLTPSRLTTLFTEHGGVMGG